MIVVLGRLEKLPIFVFPEEYTMFYTTQLRWTPHPLPCKVENGRIEITTQPETDLWKETLNHSSCVNAPVLQTQTSEQDFSFTVKTAWKSTGLYACSPRDSSFTAVFTDMDFQVLRADV